MNKKLEDLIKERNELDKEIIILEYEIQEIKNLQESVDDDEEEDTGEFGFGGDWWKG